MDEIVVVGNLGVVRQAQIERINRVVIKALLPAGELI